MAERYRLIRYDPRGFGLSGDPPGGWGAQTASQTQMGMTMEEQGLDIEAVMTAISVDSVALLAVRAMGPVGILFAVGHPELVSHLILADTFSNFATGADAALAHTQRAVILVEAELGHQVPTLGFEREIPGDEIEAVAQLSKATLERVIYPPRHVQFDWNVDTYLEDVTTPTLVISSRARPGYAQAVLRDGRGLASRIKPSQLRIVDGTFAPYFAARSQVFDAIDGFLKPERVPTRSSGFRTIVFTDIVDSTKFMSKVGDEKGRQAMRAIETRVAFLADRHGGQVVKNLGDGSLVSFGSNTAALRFALAIQAETNPGGLHLRVGMAAGEPIEEEADIHGAVVAYASLVADLGGPGEIVASDTVRQLAMGKGFGFTSMGQYDLKGFDEPATVWKVEPNPAP